MDPGWSRTICEDSLGAGYSSVEAESITFKYSIYILQFLLSGCIACFAPGPHVWQDLLISLFKHAWAASGSCEQCEELFPPSVWPEWKRLLPWQVTYTHWWHWHNEMLRMDPGVLLWSDLYCIAQSFYPTIATYLLHLLYIDFRSWMIRQVDPNFFSAYFNLSISALGSAYGNWGQTARTNSISLTVPSNNGCDWSLPHFMCVCVCLSVSRVLDLICFLSFAFLPISSIHD